MMSEFGPSERVVDLASLGPEAAELLKGVLSGDERLLLTCDGKVVAAIATLEDARTLRRADKLQRDRLEPFLRIGRKFKDVPTEELEAEDKKAITQVRTEMYGEPYRPEWD